MQSRHCVIGPASLAPSFVGQTPTEGRAVNGVVVKIRLQYVTTKRGLVLGSVRVGPWC